jgi:hypothetical protein
VNHGISGLCVNVCSTCDYVLFNDFYDEHVKMIKEGTKDKLMKTVE